MSVKIPMYEKAFSAAGVRDLTEVEISDRIKLIEMFFYQKINFQPGNPQFGISF